MVFAASSGGQGLGTIGGGGLGPFGAIKFGGGQAGAVTALSKITATVSAIIGFMTIAAGIWFMFQLLAGGYEWISSGGDTKKLQSARDRMSHGFFGLIIIIGAWALLSVTGQFLGYDILLTNPGALIQQLQIK
jgi:hypothetical protein